MKNLKTVTYLLMIMTAFAVGCKKDGDNPEGGSKNNYQYQGKTSSIKEATFFNLAVAGNNILSMTLKAEETSNWVQLLFYKSSTAIPEGTFTYHDNSTSGYDPSKHFSGGYVKLAISDSDEIRGGTIVITKSKDIYTVTVDASTSKGPVKGNYTGIILNQQ